MIPSIWNRQWNLHEFRFRGSANVPGGGWLRAASDLVGRVSWKNRKKEVHM